MNRSICCIGSLLCFVLQGYALGQGQSGIISNNDDFLLFESLDNAQSNNASSIPGRNTGRDRGARNTAATPTFMLVGTSRIGSIETAILKHMNGEIVRVPLVEGISIVPDFETYAVINRGSGNVSLRHPASEPCADFPEQGVSCDTETNIAALSLTTARAVVVATAEPETEVEEELDAVEESPRNPFEAIRDRGRAAGSTQATRFQPRRIDPADVPPGMRVVSTPFGDRLVQQ